VSDETFERFRRKLADVVTVAINEGKRVSVVSDCHCPLGCHPSAKSSIPFAKDGADMFGISGDDALSFIRGFTSRTDREEWPQYDRGSYYELGRLYGWRFP
jgi:hypothetical protein